MEVFVLEFTFFSSVHWSYVGMKITAISLEQLESEVKDQLKCMYSSETIESEWVKIKGRIEKTTLEFPLVEEHVLY